jgi:hypothetical protein
MARDPNDEDDTFRVQATKEVWFMNQDLQERGFECLVEHHDIERVTSSEDHIHISCVVLVLEDDCIEVPPPSVQRSICESFAAQAPVEGVFHVGAECWVMRTIRADVAKVSCVMEAMLYSPGVESSSETVTIIDTHPEGFSVLIKYASEGSLPEEADLWDTPANAWPYLLSVVDMYQIQRLKLHCASQMWDMASEETATSFLHWEIQANCTQLLDKYMSLLEQIFPRKILTYD